MVNTKPAVLDQVPPDGLIDVDVRETLRAGGEPFGRIMQALSNVPEGGVLRVRAIFEPAPLYGVMATHGYEHWTERLADDDWRIWFYVPSTADAAAEARAQQVDRPVVAAPPTSPGPEDDVVVLDVRDLEPPEPMVRTLGVLEGLPAGKTLVQLNTRVPRFLLPRLEERGFEYEIHEEVEGLVRVLIRQRAQASDAVEATTPDPPAPGAPRVLDVRPIPPRDKHPTIFETFDALEAGDSFILVNDHDPRPLRYQFEAERTGTFGWDYLEQGPTEWRVRISKSAR